MMASRLDITAIFCPKGYRFAGGSSAGSMFSVNNVVSVSATVGLIGREGLIIQKVFIFLLYCVIVEGVIGAIAVYGLS